VKLARRAALVLWLAAGAACAPVGPREAPAPEPRAPARADSAGVPPGVGASTTAPPHPGAAPDSQRAPGSELRDVAADPRPALDIPSLPREFRGLWVATVANLDWPSRPGLSTAEQQRELLAILDLAQRLRMNTVLLQVRPAADAIYPTVLAPWSDYLTGEMGKPPEPYWDPLAFAVEEAHRRGLELHAWFNPFRARSALAGRPAAETHVTRARPDLVRRYGRLLWLDPGEVEAQDLAVAAVLDVVRRYDVDGVVFDDYFYPYPERDARGRVLEFPDDASYAKYTRAGGTLAKDDWRRENIDRFVERVYREVKRERPHVKVGISPFGIWRPGEPASVKGMDAYAVLYADSRRWLQEGWVDWLAPQLYWRGDAAEQGFDALLGWWLAQDTLGRHVWPGLAPNRIGAEGHDWKADEVLEPVRHTRALSPRGASGHVLYSARALLGNRDGIADRLEREAYAEPALPPPMPWLDAEPPGAPTASARVIGEDGARRIRLDFRPAEGEEPFVWVVRVWDGKGWTIELVPGAARTHVLAMGASAPVAVAVSAVDRAGNEGPAEVVWVESQ